MAKHERTVNTLVGYVDTLIRKYHPKPKLSSRMGQRLPVLTAVGSQQSEVFTHEDAPMRRGCVFAPSGDQVRHLMGNYLRSPRPNRKRDCSVAQGGEGASPPPSPPIPDRNMGAIHGGCKRLALIQGESPRFHFRELHKFPCVNFGALKVSSHVRSLSDCSHVALLVKAELHVAGAGRVEAQVLSAPCVNPTRDHSVVAVVDNRGKASVPYFPYRWFFNDVVHSILSFWLCMYILPNRFCENGNMLRFTA